MESQHELDLFEEIGGEPLEGSGFESEKPASQDELVLGISLDQREGDEL